MPGSIDLGGLAKSNVVLKKRSNLADDTADVLRGMILLEQLPPGMPLPERDISAALGISRTPLREAIRLLEREGLVEYSASRRPRVANPSLEEIADYLRVQGALEALGGELACANATDTELENIARLNREMLEMSGEEDPLISFKRDMEVHSAIVAAGHNEPLVETHATYNARLWRARFVSSQRRMSRDSTIREHQDIVKALLSRNPQKTAQALKSHLTTAISNIAKALKERAEKA
jgi:DNA-binding GntR family transcriptional regulator